MRPPPSATSGIRTFHFGAQVLSSKVHGFRYVGESSEGRRSRRYSLGGKMGAIRYVISCSWRGLNGNPLVWPGCGVAVLRRFCQNVCRRRKIGQAGSRAASWRCGYEKLLEMLTFMLLTQELVGRVMQCHESVYWSPETRHAHSPKPFWPSFRRHVRMRCLRT